MRLNWICLIFLPLFWTCGSEKTSEKEQKEVITPVDEDDLAIRLSMMLIPNPRSQAQKDHNEIVDYAIGKMLDVQKTSSGLFYQLTKKGKPEDQAPRWGDIVYVNYKGSFLDGTVFDQSTKKKPLKIKLKQVIPGWQEALLLMRPGAKGTFLIPSYLGYGEKGFGKNIPPNKVLLFEMEIVDIDRY